MKPRVIVITLILAAGVAACEPSKSADESQPARADQEQKKRKDPVAGVANNLQGIQRGSEDSFGRAADSMP